MNSTVRFMLRYRSSWLFAMVGLSLVSAVAGLAAPFFQKVFVDRLTGVSPETQYGNTWLATVESFLFSYHPLYLLGTAFGFMLFTQWISTLTGWIGLRESVKRQEIIGEVVYQKTLSLRQDQTVGQTVGEVVSIYATDVVGSTAIVDQTIPLGAGVIFPFICAPIAVQLICGIPVTYTVLVMLVVLSFSIFLSVRQSRFFQSFKRLAADRTGLVNEWIQNIRLLRILGWVESFEKKIFNKREEETVNRVRMVTNGQMMGAFGSSINFFMNLVAVITLTNIKGAQATPGDFFALLWIFGVFLSRPFRQVPWIFTFTFDGWTSINRVEAFLNRHKSSLKFDLLEYAQNHYVNKQSRLSESTSSSREGRTGRALTVEGLSLSVGSRPLLDNVSFSLEAGEFAAIVGEVGSGKTLLLMSLLGETAAEVRNLKVGTQQIADMAREARRAYFGFVPQDGFVMSANLRENVVFRYDAGNEYDAGVLKALRAAQFDPSSEGITDGLATEFGERGVNLSGGQRQRVGLARAAYLSRPVVLLDDALSAVDVETEKLLFETLLFGEWQKTTRLMVTHRLSVLERVDRVIFMRGGKIHDQGKFRELVARNVEFQEFVSSMDHKDPTVSPQPLAIKPEAPLVDDKTEQGNEEPV
ncbi:MAG: ABC transporter ATP-binding protein/permease [Bdellovibrionales bacterium]|nr:ABC transporter ATP-binding protein/permease [Bdellovibrionales bacterium]